jgi:hypothetical protein
VINGRDSSGRFGPRNTIKTDFAEAQELNDLVIHSRLHQGTLNTLRAEIQTPFRSFFTVDPEKEKKGMPAAEIGLSTNRCAHSKWRSKQRSDLEKVLNDQTFS